MTFSVRKNSTVLRDESYHDKLEIVKKCAQWHRDNTKVLEYLAYKQARSIICKLETVGKAVRYFAWYVKVVKREEDGQKEWIIIAGDCFHRETNLCQIVLPVWDVR